MNRIEIESLKGRVDLVKVVGHYLPLEKKGTAWLGLCPFHDDHHPSLRVDPSKGMYHCFSCGVGGDVFRFVQEKEGCGFPDAVRICADICHLSVPTLGAGVQKTNRVEQTEQKKKSDQMKPQLPAPTIEENEEYGKSLLPYDPGMEELRETYAAFGVGIAPAVVPKAWEFTRGRIVFPIRNDREELVAFAARYRGDLSVGKIPKYINSSTSAIYKKEELLYGWYRAVKRVGETGVVFLTEGYKDTLAMHAAGFSNTVAICGTHLSEYHIARIQKEAVTVCLILDADEVGRKTVTEITPKLRKAGLRVIDILPERGKDADEIFRAMGREAFIGWMRQRMIPKERQEAESLLVGACRCWPDTGCLSAEGEEMPYIESIQEVLSNDDLLPEDVANRECLLALTSESEPREASPELLRAYELHTEASHSERVRRSELICYFLHAYLEKRLADRVRRHSRCLSRLLTNKERYLQQLSLLQDERNYLRSVSEVLGRR